MTIYSSMDAAIILCIIHMVSNCCLSLYLNIIALRQGPGKVLLVSWKVLEFFVTKRVGTVLTTDHKVLPATHMFIQKWNESYLL